MNSKRDDGLYLQTLERIRFCNDVLYEGVCFEEWEVMNCTLYKIKHNGKEFMVPSCRVIQTHILTRLDNVSASEHMYNQRSDKTTDYHARIKEELGIDVTKNVMPDFRDGINPSSDLNI